MTNTIQQIVSTANDKINKKEPLELVLESIKHISRGLFLEFGVWQGHTINLAARTLKQWQLYGFDSFEGLPERWRDGYDKGMFSLNGNLPKVLKNTVLVKGWFDATIPIWINAHPEHKEIDILHIDCDIYSSTKTIFDNLKNMITTNTIIIFDELINYPDYENHEIKAFCEFLQENNYQTEVLFAGGYNNEKVAVKLIKK